MAYRAIPTTVVILAQPESPKMTVKLAQADWVLGLKALPNPAGHDRPGSMEQTFGRQIDLPELA